MKHLTLLNIAGKTGIRVLFAVFTPNLFTFYTLVYKPIYWPFYVYISGNLIKNFINKFLKNTFIYVFFLFKIQFALQNSS